MTIADQLAERLREMEQGRNLETKERPMEETRECESCAKTKPLGAFEKRGRGRARVCRECENREIEDFKAEGQASATPPPILPDSDWRAVFRDPRVSQLQELQAILGVETLEETADVARLISELEWAE